MVNTAAVERVAANIGGLMPKSDAKRSNECLAKIWSFLITPSQNFQIETLDLTFSTTANLHSIASVLDLK